MTTETVYANDLPYWKTGTSDPDTILDKAVAQIQSVDGVVLGRATMEIEGRAIFALRFRIGSDEYRAEWPILQPKDPKDMKAARRQAASMLFHDIKAKVVAAKAIGAKAAFFGFLELEDGRIAQQLAAPELVTQFPRIGWNELE